MCVDLQARGKNGYVPATVINGHTVVVTGKWLKCASVKDEDLADAQTFDHPEIYINALKMSALKSDFFTFAQKPPDLHPRHPYMVEWDNAAVVPITTYADWLDNRVEHDVKKAVRKASKLGVTVQVVKFDETLVRGITAIYSESPIRQGKAFAHYRKDFATVKREAETHLDKSEFIGAYYMGELIGFIKMAHLGRLTATIHVIAMKKHFDKKPMAALLAKAVETCERRGSSHLIYGSYVYNDPNSSLTEFKRRNGFEKVLLPRYYVPLTWKGQIALKLRLHRGPSALLPQPMKREFIRTRAAINKFFARREQLIPTGAGGL
jgi:hypothetical protein